jgi:TonB family protein
MFALLLSTLVAQAAPAYLAACPAQEAKVLFTAPVIAPDGIHPTNRRARFFLDLGSDGRIRHVTLVETSGDSTFDSAALNAAQNFRFAPPTQGCISTSSVVPEDFNVPLLALARPVPGASGAPGVVTLPSALPASAVAICGAPSVQLKGLDVPDTRQAPGTVEVAVALDASARVTSVKLAKSSGNAKTDAVAVSSAKDAGYAFLLAAGCPAKATTYQLELTYH